jgi:hypothetical protein
VAAARVIGQRSLPILKSLRRSLTYSARRSAAIFSIRGSAFFPTYPKPVVLRIRGKEDTASPPASETGLRRRVPSKVGRGASLCRG